MRREAHLARSSGGRRCSSSSADDGPGPIPSSSWRYMARQKVSVFELVVARALERYGYMKGGRVGGRMVAFVIEWAKYQAATGDSPGNANAFAIWAALPRATAYRRLDEFCELFPEHQTPAPLARYVDVPAPPAKRSSAVTA